MGTVPPLRKCKSTPRNKHRPPLGEALWRYHLYRYRLEVPMYELLLSQTRFKMPPIHFWLDPSDQPVGSTVITDKSGNNISVANTGVTVSDDSPIDGMKSMQFTGGSYKYLRIPHAEMGNLRAGNFTIEYWAKLEDTDGIRAIFSQWAQKANGGGVLCLATATDNFNQIHYGPNNENGYLINKGYYPVGGWVHVTWIRAGSSWSLFINGRRVVTSVFAPEGNAIDIDYMLGAYFDPSGNIGTPTSKPLIGKIADFRIYRNPAHLFNFDPITGDEYLGEVSEETIITGADLAAQVGLTGGDPIARASAWLRFRINGKELLIAKKPMRNKITWQILSNAGLLEGSKRIIANDGKTYKVRVPYGAEANPTKWRVADDTADDPAICGVAEYTRMLYGVHESVGKFAKMTDADLGIGAANITSGRMTICVERVGNPTRACVARSNEGLKNFNYPDAAPPGGAELRHYGWRPVLELTDPMPVYPDSGPGGKTLPYGDMESGYFGRVASSLMPTQAAIEAAGGSPLTTGTVVNNAAVANDLWLKFAYKGNILYIPRRALRTGVTWEAVYKAGLVYGTDDDGKYPHGSPKNQKAYVQGADETGRKIWFKVRLMSGMVSDPANPFDSDVAVKAKGTEYYKTMERVIPAVGVDQAWDTTGFQSGNIILQETVTGSTGTTGGFNCVGNGNSNAGTRGSAQKASTTGSWYPCLELLPLDFDPFPTIPDNGPGNKKLQEYNPSTQSGYFGRVAATDMPSIDSIEAAGAKSVGGTRNPNTTAMSWLKFVRKGKVFYYPSVALRTGTDWNSIYAAGFVYGVDGNGKYPATPAVNQRRTVTFVDGDGETWVFLVRLASMSSVDPYSHTASGQQAALSEYTETIQNVYETSPLKWDNLPRKEALGIETNDTYTVSAAMTATDFNAISNWPKDGNAGKKEWFPVLELIPNP